MPASERGDRPGFVKVPAIMVSFWVIKILTTGMGEATSDYLAHRFNPILAGVIGLITFVVILAIQLRADRYRPWLYWATVAMVAVFGTMAADGLHVELHVPYLVSTVFYAGALGVVFIIWQRTEKTLSIHSIDTPRRELFYWATVSATFAMGTALGDLTAHTWGLGYLTSGVLFAVLFAVLFVVPGAAHRLLRLNPVAAFWTAYIITRPLGACFADWLGVPKNLSGLGLGRGVVSVSLAALIVGGVAYTSRAHRSATASPTEVPAP